VAEFRRSRNLPGHFIFSARSLAPAGKPGRISSNPATGKPRSPCASREEPGAAIPHAEIFEGAPVDRRPYLNQGDDEMDIIEWAVIIGAICCAAAPSITFRLSARKKYADRDEQSALRTKVSAERMCKICGVIAVLAPVPLMFTLPMLEPAVHKEIIAAAMILVVTGVWCSFWAFLSVARIAGAELDARGRQKKEIPNQQSESIGR
jgi:hypothetical protein